MKYTADAYAKINLYLRITGKRPDGYHEIESVMQQISLHDTVSLTVSEPHSGTAPEKNIAITCTDETVPTDERNIIWKCAHAFFETFSIPVYRVQFDLVKRIPSAAGLGGGSSDGAAVLHLLNDAFGIHASLTELCAIGARVGADIPFCLVGKTCICRGIGDILSPVSLPVLPYGILLAFPGNGISTPKAYQMLDMAEPDPMPHTLADILLPLQAGQPPLFLSNDFERVILPVHPAASALRSRMFDLGAVSSLMSGSGPSVFGIFDDTQALSAAEAQLRAEKIPVFPCTPIF